MNERLAVIRARKLRADGGSKIRTRFKSTSTNWTRRTSAWLAVVVEVVVVARVIADRCWGIHLFLFLE